jgi:excisionase family DNA binding protein
MAVTVSLNNKIDANQAAQILGCAYSHVINLIHKKKFKAQKVGKAWMLDSDEVYKAKETGMVKGRAKKLSGPGQVNIPKPPSLLSSSNSDSQEIRLTISREKFEIIKLAFKGKDKTVVTYLNDQLEKLYQQVQEKLQGIEF